MLCNFAFVCIVIGRIVRPQIDDKDPEASAIYVRFWIFPVKCLSGSICTQKTLDRDFKELTNDVQFIKFTINLKLNKN